MQFHQWHLDVLEPVLLKPSAGQPDATQIVEVGTVDMTGGEQIRRETGDTVVEGMPVEHDAPCARGHQRQESDLHLEIQGLVRDDLLIVHEIFERLRVLTPQSVGIGRPHVHETERP